MSVSIAAGKTRLKMITVENALVHYGIKPAYIKSNYEGYDVPKQKLISTESAQPHLGHTEAPTTDLQCAIALPLE